MAESISELDEYAKKKQREYDVIAKIFDGMEQSPTSNKELDKQLQETKKIFDENQRQLDLVKELVRVVDENKEDK